jgi:L-amino acid N-acyltransferase YncA
MQTRLKLRNGTEVLIRPQKKRDLDQLLHFFKAMPDKDKRFLRYDVSDRNVLEQRFRATKTGRVRRLVAVIDDQIAADGVLELEGHGWKEHVGELRLFVSRAYRRKGLGMLMARELYKLASVAKVEEVVVKMMRPQIAARKIFRRLGFHEEVVLPDYVKDRGGKVQDLVVMRCDLASLWQLLEDYFTASDWQRTR